jgi:ATP-binding cassette subfamily B protein
MAKLPNIIEKERSLSSTLWFVLRESVKGSKYSIPRYIAGALTAVFVVAQFGAIGIIVNEFVTHGIGGVDIAVLIKAVIFLLITEFGPEVISVTHDYFGNTQSDDLSRHLQAKLFKKMEHLDIGTIEQPEFQNIVEIANNRGWNSFYTIVNYFSIIARNLSRLIVSSVALVVISPLAFAIIFVGSLPTYIVERKSALLSVKLNKDVTESWRTWRIKAGIIEEKDQLIEIKNFSLIPVFKQKFLDALTPIHQKFQVLRKRELFNDIFAQVILAIAFAGALGLLIRDVFTGHLAIGSLVFVFGVVTQFQYAISELFRNFGRMAEYKKNVDTLLDLLEIEPLIVSGNQVIEPKDFRTLEVRDVSFRYPSGTSYVLEKISLSISRGDHIAIVGLNGAGKSTLLKLLTRVYDPTKGKILINGIDLKKYNLESWRHCLGILLQEYFMYTDETVTENIMLGNAGKQDKERMRKSAVETTASEFIKELPKKYNQLIGTEFRGGVELSKGQKQKIALARTLYRNAPIIILDEPTASVDAISEDAIFGSLHKNHQDQTRIVISHKFSNVRDADRIILIEYRKIIEQGTHDELMAIENGKYKELFLLQAEGYK